MSSPESIHRLLAAAVQLLGSAASEIREAPLDPARDHIARIGRALAEIFEIELAIYETHPELKPEHLKQPSPDPDANRRLTHYMVEALDLEEAGRIEAAIAKFRTFITLESSPFHIDIAKGEIDRLRTEQRRS